MPKFISNKVKDRGEDLFEGKSHESIAGTLAAAIKEDDAQGAGRIIGLEGVWGSGKSNVIELTKQRLNPKGKDKYLFVDYDLWLHQTDDIKVTLLDSVVQALRQPCNLSNSWIDDIKQLLSTKTVAQVSERPRLGCSAVCVIVFFILSSLLGFFGSKLLKNTIGFVLSLIVLALLALIVLVTLVIKFFEARKVNVREYKVNELCRWPRLCKEYSVFIKSFSDSCALTFALYSNQKTDVENRTSIYEETTSSDGYRNKISELDKVIGEYSHHLVIVLDNLDRVGNDKVRELWSSLITLFVEGKFNHITVVVPFDRKHVQATFEEGGNNTKEEAEDFVNKTFHFVLRVSTPIMSDWKTFFVNKWKEAFDDKEPEGVVTQIYELLDQNKTPRSIIAFINKVVAICKWEENLPTPIRVDDKYKTLYVLCRKNIECLVIKENGTESRSCDEAANILNMKTYGEAAYLFKHDSSLTRFICTLHYQLPPDRAEEVAIINPLVSNLEHNKPERIKELSQSKMWKHLLQTALERVTDIEKATLALNEVLKGKDEDCKFLWDILFNRLNSVEGSKQEQSFKKYQQILFLNIHPQKQYLQKIINDYESNFFVLQNGMRTEKKDADPTQYISDIDTLATFVPKEFNLFQRLQKHTIDPQHFMEFVERKKEDYRKYSLYSDNDLLDKYLTELPEEELAKVTTLSILLADDYNLSGFHSALVQQLKSHMEAVGVVNGNFRFDNFEPKAMLQELRLISEYEKPTGVLFEPTFLHYYYQYDSQHNNREFIIAYLAQLIAHEATSTGTTINTYKGSPENINDKELCAEVAAVLPDHIDLNQFFARWSVYGAKSLFATVTTSIIENGVEIQDFNIADFSDNYQMITVTTGLTPEKVMHFINVSKPQVTANETANVSNDLIEDCLSFDDIPFCKNLVASSCEYLNELSDEYWKERLDIDDDGNYELIEILGERNKLPKNCFKAFRALSLEKLKDGETIDSHKAKYIIDRAIADKLSVAGFAKALSREYLKYGSKINEQQFVLYVPLMLKYGELSSDKNSLGIIFREDVIAEEACQQIILDNKEEVLKVYGVADEADQELFRDQMPQLFEEPV